MPVRLTPSIFIARARKIHGDKYTYDNLQYIKSTFEVTVTCPIHGDFQVNASNHLYRKQGCQRCTRETVVTRTSDTQDSFIAKARKKHNDKYDYSKVVYLGSTSKVEIICPEHGSFWQRASSHLAGNECKSCWLDRRKARSLCVRRKKTSISAV